MFYAQYQEACNCHTKLNTSKARLFGSLIARDEFVTPMYYCESLSKV